MEDDDFVDEVSVHKDSEQPTSSIKIGTGQRRKSVRNIGIKITEEEDRRKEGKTAGGEGLMEGEDFMDKVASYKDSEQPSSSRKNPTGQRRKSVRNIGIKIQSEPVKSNEPENIKHDSGADFEASGSKDKDSKKKKTIFRGRSKGDDSRKKGKLTEEEGIYFRSIPKHFVNMISNLSGDQTVWIALTGFGDFMNFHFKDVPRTLGYKIVDAFEPAGVKMVLRAGNIFITESDVAEVLGMPKGEVEIDLGTESKKNRDLWRSQFDTKEKRKISMLMVLEKLKENEKVDFFFKWNFLVVCTNTFIQSQTNAFLSQKILDFNGDIDNCANYNWCSKVIESLTESTLAWKREGGKRIFTGPIIFLVIFYVDRVVYRGKRSVDRGIPTWYWWSEEALKKRATEEMDTNSFGKGKIEKSQWELVLEKAETDEGKPNKVTIARLEAYKSRLITITDEYTKTWKALVSKGDIPITVLDMNSNLTWMMYNFCKSIGEPSQTSKDPTSGGSKEDLEKPEQSKKGKETARDDITPPTSKNTMPSFSLGLTQTTPMKQGKSKEDVTDEVADIPKFYTEKFKDVDDVGVVGEKFVSSTKESTEKAKVQTKRTLKPSAALKSPFIDRVIDIEIKTDVEESKMWNWVMDRETPITEIIFKWGKNINLRHELLTFNNNSICVTIVDCWTLLLNNSEAKRSNTSPYRFYFPSVVMNEGDVCVNFEEFKFKLSKYLKMFTNVNLAEVDMVFLPVLDPALHYFLICYNFKRQIVDIIDNRVYTYPNENSYSGTHLQSYFTSFLESIGHSKAKTVKSFNLKWVDMPWKTCQKM